MPPCRLQGGRSGLIDGRAHRAPGVCCGVCVCASCLLPGRRHSMGPQAHQAEAPTRWPEEGPRHARRGLPLDGLRACGPGRKKNKQVPRRPGASTGRCLCAAHPWGKGGFCWVCGGGGGGGSSGGGGWRRARAYPYYFLVGSNSKGRPPKLFETNGGSTHIIMHTYQIYTSPTRLKRPVRPSVRSSTASSDEETSQRRSSAVYCGLILAILLYGAG
jgi:hypothetical protein